VTSFLVTFWTKSSYSFSSPRDLPFSTFSVYSH